MNRTQEKKTQKFQKGKLSYKAHTKEKTTYKTSMRHRTYRTYIYMYIYIYIYIERERNGEHKINLR